MATKRKFKTEEDYQKAVNAIEWTSRVGVDQLAQELQARLASVPHKTDSLTDAGFLLKLFAEKIAEHNGRCKQLAGQMKQSYYKRNNIEGY